MLFYMAPLEGITTYLYRNVHNKMFPGVDKYFTPFVSPSSNHDFKSREKKDVIPEHNEGIPLVPQILSNKADEFLYTAERLVEFGYREINLNLGCPSGTVVSKGRGAGFLSQPDDLDRFLDSLFKTIEVPLSVKTRIGREDPMEFKELIKIYNKYPIYELTIHPRVGSDFYKGKPNWDVFEMALESSTNPVCYNGDICSKEDYESFCRRFPTVDRIMIGRGLIANPGLIRELQTGQKTTWEECLEYAAQLQQEYQQVMPEIPVLFKMKELWSYMSGYFPKGDKIWKGIKKAKRLSDYNNVVRTL